jgi:hypothetical protein
VRLLSISVTWTVNDLFSFRNLTNSSNLNEFVCSSSPIVEDALTTSTAFLPISSGTGSGVGSAGMETSIVDQGRLHVGQLSVAKLQSA